MPRVVPPIEGRSTGNLTPSVIESAAGFSAGVVATLAVHPFDILKTRLQLEIDRKSRPGDSFRVLRSIVRDEGSFRALYRGLMPNMIGNSVSWALYFLWYRNIKDMLQYHRGAERLRSVDYFVASGTSGILTAICTNPIWVIKTRMISTGRDAPGAYRNIADGITKLYRSEGLPGFWRGLLPSLFGVSHGAIQFVAYEQLKNQRAEQRGPNSELSNWDYLTLSGLSKIFAGSVTYPYQVVRSRLQVYNAREVYKGAGDVVTQVWRKEGIGGFYKGIVPNVVRVLPSTCVTFLVYENTKYYLPKFWHRDEDAHVG